MPTRELKVIKFSFLFLTYWYVSCLIGKPLCWKYYLLCLALQMFWNMHSHYSVMVLAFLVLNCCLSLRDACLRFQAFNDYCKDLKFCTFRAEVLSLFDPVDGSKDQTWHTAGSHRVSLAARCCCLVAGLDNDPPHLLNKSCVRKLTNTLDMSDCSAFANYEIRSKLS